MKRNWPCLYTTPLAQNLVPILSYLCLRVDIDEDRDVPDCEAETSLPCTPFVTPSFWFPPFSFSDPWLSSWPRRSEWQAIVTFDSFSRATDTWVPRETDTRDLVRVPTFSKVPVRPEVALVCLCNTESSDTPWPNYFPPFLWVTRWETHSKPLSPVSFFRKDRLTTRDCVPPYEVLWEPFLSNFDENVYSSDPYCPCTDPPLPVPVRLCVSACAMMSKGEIRDDLSNIGSSSRDSIHFMMNSSTVVERDVHRT